MELEELNGFLERMNDLGFRSIMLTPYMDIFLAAEKEAYYAVLKIDHDDATVNYRLDFTTGKDNLPSLSGYRATLRFKGDDREYYHYFKMSDGNIGPGAQDAYNLIAGRSVLMFSERSSQIFTGRWVSFLPVKEDDTTVFFKEQGVENFDVFAALRKLPLLELETAHESLEILLSLVAGNKVSGHIKDGNGHRKVGLRADPAGDNIIVDDCGEKQLAQHENNKKRVGRLKIKRSGRW